MFSTWDLFNIFSPQDWGYVFGEEETTEVERLFHYITSRAPAIKLTCHC